MKKIQKKSGMSTAKIVAIGVVVAATTAGAYLLFGPDGKKNRKTVKGWAIKMKGEIIEKFEKAKHLTLPVYNSIIDEVSKKYAKIKDIDKKELEAIASDARRHWNTIANSKKKTVAKVSTKKK